MAEPPASAREDLPVSLSVSPGDRSPVRVQRRRVKGYRMPEGTVSVTRPGRWGNPYRVGDLHAVQTPGAEPGPEAHYTAESAVEAFRAYASRRSEVDPEWLAPLRGRDLACYCAVGAAHCHADVLLELANRQAPAKRRSEDT